MLEPAAAAGAADAPSEVRGGGARDDAPARKKRDWRRMQYIMRVLNLNFEGLIIISRAKTKFCGLGRIRPKVPSDRC